MLQPRRPRHEAKAAGPEAPGVGAYFTDPHLLPCTNNARRSTQGKYFLVLMLPQMLPEAPLCFFALRQLLQLCVRLRTYSCLRKAIVVALAESFEGLMII